MSEKKLSDDRHMRYFLGRLRFARTLAIEVGLSMITLVILWFDLTHLSTASLQGILPKSLAQNAYVPQIIIALLVLGVLWRLITNIRVEVVNFLGPRPADISCPVNFIPVRVTEPIESLRKITQTAGIPPVLVDMIGSANINRRQHHKHKILSIDEPVAEGSIIAWPQAAGVVGHGKLANLQPLFSDVPSALEDLEEQKNSGMSIMEVLSDISNIVAENVTLRLDAPNDADMEQVVKRLVVEASNGVFQIATASDIGCKWLLGRLRQMVDPEILSPSILLSDIQAGEPDILDFLDLCQAIRNSKLLSRYCEVVYPSQIANALSIISSGGVLATLASTYNLSSQYGMVTTEKIRSIGGGGEHVYAVVPGNDRMPVIPVGMAGDECLVVYPPTDLSPVKICPVITSASEYAEVINRYEAVVLGALLDAAGNGEITVTELPGTLRLACNGHFVIEIGGNGDIKVDLAGNILSQMFF